MTWSLVMSWVLGKAVGFCTQSPIDACRLWLLTVSLLSTSPSSILCPLLSQKQQGSKAYHKDCTA